MPNGNGGHDIQFIAGQRPLALLPGTGKNVSSDPLAEKAERRAEYSLDMAIQATSGERPVLGGENKGGKWVAGQLTVMSQQGFLPEHPGAYFRTRDHKKVLGFTPTSHFLVQEKQALIEATGQINGLRVLGTGNALRSKGQIESAQDSARMSVALPGDLNTFREMLELINRKLRGEMIKQPLIIENPDQGPEGHYWDEILRSLKMLDKDTRVGVDPLERRAYVDFKALAHHYGIYITENRADTVDLIQSLDQQLPTPEEEFTEKPIIPDGSILFVATGTMKKYEELERVLKKQGVNTRIRSIFELVDTYVSPKETSGTYEGNVAEKVRAALNAWHQMDEETRVERLKHLGITKAQAFILAEDSGFHFLEPNIVLEDEFGDIRHHVDINAPFPGVETGPGTIGSNGIANFMMKISQIFARRPNANRDTISKSILAIAPLDQANYTEDQIFMLGSETECTFTDAPRPNTGSLEIANYLVPKNLPGLPKGQTEKQLGARFEEKFSARAVAWKALSHELGIVNGQHAEITQDYSSEFVAGVVTTQFNETAYGRAQDLAATVHQDGFRITCLDPTIKNPRAPQEQIFANADGIILAFNPATAEQDIWENLYLLSSAIVGEQTHDKFKFRKPVCLVNPDGTFDHLKELVYDLHHLGTVPEDPASLLKIVGSVDEAIKTLKIDRKHYRRFHVPHYAIQENPNEVEGRDSPYDFNVGALLSASTQNATALGDAARLANGLIDRKIGIYTGGGAYGPMGVITTVAHERRNTHGAYHSASSVPHIMSGEGDVRDLVNQFKLARDIYERMEFIYDGRRKPANAFAVLTGGTGTVQETALLAIQGRPTIVVNRKIRHRGVDRGFYDVFDRIVPDNHPAKDTITWVDSVDAALAEIDQMRSAPAPVTA